MTIDLRKIPKTKPATWDDLLTKWTANTKRSVGEHGPEVITLKPGVVVRYSDDQPRDDHGRWVSEGGGDEEAQHQDRLGRIKVPVADLTAPGQDGNSASRYLQADGTFTPERQALHDKIVADAIAGIPKSDDPTFYMLGGGPASGKSELLAAGIGDVPGNDEAVHIDADAIKLQLPDVAEKASEGDPGWAAYGHEESSYLAKRIQAAAIENGQDFVLDGTGDSAVSSVERKIDLAREAGYKVNGLYVTVDTDTAVARSEARAAETGRHVPETVVREIHSAVSEVFPKVANDFDHVELYDTGGAKPRLIFLDSGGKPTVVDPMGWQAFLDKAKG